MAKQIDPVHLAVLVNNNIGLEEAIRAGSDVDALDREGRSALFYAVMEGNNKTAEILIGNGAKVNIRDKNLEAPLHFAVRGYQADLAHLLIESGAEIDTQDIYGNTPLHTAVFESRGRGAVIEVLLAKGADKTIPNKKGVSPQKLAETIVNYPVKDLLR